MLTEHSAIKLLLPYIVPAIEKALLSIQKSQKKFTSTPMEHYSYNIYNRASEIQNSLSKVELSLEYLLQKEQAHSVFKFSEHYSYHTERLIIEVFSITDRCYSLIGSSLLLTKDEIERIGSKRVIKKQARDFVDIYASLLKIETITSPYRSIRNDIAHNKSYSNEYLGYISQQESGSLPEEISIKMNEVDFKGMLNEKYTEVFKNLLISLKNAIIDLLDSLEPLYRGMSSKKQEPSLI